MEGHLLFEAKETEDLDRKAKQVRAAVAWRGRRGGVAVLWTAASLFLFSCEPTCVPQAFAPQLVMGVGKSLFSPDVVGSPKQLAAAAHVDLLLFFFCLNISSTQAAEISASLDHLGCCCCAAARHFHFLPL